MHDSIVWQENKFVYRKSFLERGKMARLEFRDKSGFRTLAILVFINEIGSVEIFRYIIELLKRNRISNSVEQIDLKSFFAPKVAWNNFSCR